MIFWLNFYNKNNTPFIVNENRLYQVVYLYSQTCDNIYEIEYYN